MNKKLIIFCCFIISIAVFNGCAKQPLPSPIVLDGVSKEMRSPGYWTAKIKKPDKVILNGDQIAKINSDIENSKFVNRLDKFGVSYSGGKKFGTAMKKSFAKYYKYKNKKLNKTQIKKSLDKISANINFQGLNSAVPVQYAITVKSADLRAIPTSMPLYSSDETDGLDRLQTTRLHISEPLIVSYKTKDEKWFYVFSREAQGWIESSMIGICSRQEWEQFGSKNNKNPKNKNGFVIVISANADIYADALKTEFIGYAQMGTHFVIEGIENSLARIKMPYADKNGNLQFKDGFIETADISKSYLKYTPRNILSQAFKYLNMPYGWGGQDDFVDCSSFIKNVFACFGIELPRNSAAQVSVSSILPARSFQKDDTEKSKSIKITGASVEAASLLYFPGHIMLYIGKENGQPYIIHSIWGYRDKSDKNLYLINKVTVSDMSLGKNSKKGSLLERTTMFKNMSQ